MNERRGEIDTEAAKAEAYERWRASGPKGMGDLDLRAAAQHANATGDHSAESAIDDALERRGQS
jgi:hypothetical protein